MRSIWRRSAGTVCAMAVGLQLDLLAVDADDAAGRVFEAVDAAQQRRLARAAAADDGDDVAVAGRQRDALQHMQLAELLVQVLDVNRFGGAVAVGAARRKRRSFGTSRSRADRAAGCRPRSRESDHHPVTLNSCTVVAGWTARLCRPSTAPLRPCGASRQWLLAVGTSPGRTAMNVQADRAVRRAVDGGAAEARPDALGRKRDAAGRGRANGTTAPGFDPVRAGRAARGLCRSCCRVGRRARMAAGCRRRAGGFGLHPRPVADDRPRRDHPVHGQGAAPRRAGAARGRLRRLGIPILGRIEAAGHRSKAATASGSTATRWPSAAACAPTRPASSRCPTCWRRIGIEVLGYDLPLWHGEEACLHLMSVISPLADDLALVHSPLLPAAVLPAAEGARHQAGRRRRGRVLRRATASALTCCRPARAR